MTTTTQPEAQRLAQSFVGNLLAGTAAESTTWLADLRRRAVERANALAVPTTRDEDWRFTDLAPLYRSAFRAPAGGDHPALSALEAHAVPEAAQRLVFVDGVLAPALSRIEPRAGVLAVGLATAATSHPDVLATHLNTLAGFESNVFHAINVAHMRDGALVHIARDAVAGPVHLLFVSTQADVAVHPRVLVVAEAGSDATLVEDYVALHEGAYWVNGVTEVSVGANARVRHIRLQRESRAAFHIATCAARVDRDARYESHSIALGGRISRLDLNVTQGGTGAHAELMGLALIHDGQLADTHSLMDHALPQGTSHQLHKCVLDGTAHAVFNGRVVVRPGAQRTDAAQQNRNLLLSRRAHIDTKPQLEIFADDVKCSHGATVGQLESEELFYLRSRGLDEAAARSLLTYGFAAEVVSGIPVASVADALRRRLVQETGAATAAGASLA
jgi:Fe-S cluster assembly protein SufD